MRLSLYKRGNVWWARGTIHGKKFRETTKTTDRNAADLIRRRWEREYADPSHHAAHQATIATAAGRFLNDLKKTAKSKATWNFYEQKVRQVARLLGNVRLVSLRREDVVSYIEMRESEGAHSHTIHRELTALRRTLKNAAAYGEFGRDVKVLIPSYSANYEPITRWLTQAEVDRLMAELEPSRAAFLAFVIASSARRKEARAALVEDVTPEVIRLRGTKTAKARREVPRLSIFRPLLRRVDAWAKTRPHGPLFDPWTNVLRGLRHACARASTCPTCRTTRRTEAGPKYRMRPTPGCKQCAALTMAPVTPNDLRRTTATWLVRAGVPFELAAKVMGHASTAMLYKVYGQMDATSLKSSIDAVTGGRRRVR